MKLLFVNRPTILQLRCATQIEKRKGHDFWIWYTEDAARQLFKD